MTVHLKNVNSQVNECKLHSIECKIHADDAANVSLYFRPSKQEDGILSCSFRGHSLDGTEIQVPKNYCGLVFKELNRKEIDGEEDRNLICTNKFDSFTYWNWNKIPSKNDPLISALDWIDISQAIHDPVEEQEEEKEDSNKMDAL